MQNKNAGSFLLLIKYVRPYKTKFIFGLLFIIIASFGNMLFPYLLKKLIDGVNTQAIGKGDIDSNTILLIMLLLVVFQTIISYFRLSFFISVGENVIADIRNEIYQKTITATMNFFTLHRVGELSSRVQNDTSQIRETISISLAETIKSILTLAIGVGLLFYISLKLTLLILLLIPVIGFLGKLFNRPIRKTALAVQDELAKSNTILHETLHDISVVKAFSNEWFEISRYNKISGNVVKLANKNGKSRALFGSVLFFCVFGSIAVIVWYGAYLMKAGAISFGDLMAFVVYTAYVAGSIGGLADLYSEIQKMLGASQRIRELLAMETEELNITDKPVKEEHILSGSISVKNVSFSYPSRIENPVLKNITMHIKSGQHIAILGPSGSGKSTIFALLLGFYKFDTGNISFDGKNSEDFPLSQLRKQIALVPQDLSLFGGTILENIAYGNLSASRKSIEKAAKEANAHDFILSFPHGYDTIVGEGGMMLSGGQRQRIALARTFLKNPIILLLDEATSSLDSESEILVQQAINNLMKNRTTISIAHRLSAIQNADNIFVLEAGSIVESGTHLELIKNETGLYRRLKELQDIQ